MPCVMAKLFPSAGASYVVISILGQGHYGKVYLCKHNVTGVQVAVEKIEHNQFLAFKVRRQSTLNIDSEVEMVKRNTEDGLLQ